MTDNAGLPWFTCDSCGATFLKGRSDTESELDAMLTWGQVPDAGYRAVVCDACNQQILAWAQANGIL